MRRLPALVLVTALVLGLAGCDGTAGGGSRPTGADPQVGTASTGKAYAARDCPADVATELVGPAKCGTLTVPETRGADSARSVSLLVVSISPPEITATEPIVVVGTDIATEPNYGGIAPLAQRTGRRVLILEQRGVGHSVPSLACPPILGRVSWSARTGSAGWRSDVSDAERGCGRHLVASGVRLAAYDIAAMAGDVVDLIDTLHLGRVDLISYGSSSRVALEVMRDHPDRLRAVVLDSPDLPGVDSRAGIASATRTAIARVSAWCAEDDVCRSAHPAPRTLMRRALSAVDPRPMRLRVPWFPRSTTAPRRVVLDAGLLVRVARQAMTDGGSAGRWGVPSALPGLLEVVAEHDRRRVRSALTELLGFQGPLCPGYRAKCMPVHRVAEGVYDSVVCRDIADARTPLPSPRGRGYGAAYGRSWWRGLCRRWPVAEAGPESREPVVSDVPTLILVGGLAPPVPAEEIRARTTGLSSLSLVIDPTQSQNVISTPCLLALRNAWLDDLAAGTPTPACVPTRLDW